MARLVEHGVSFSDFMRLRIADRAGNLAKANRTFVELMAVCREFRQAAQGPKKQTELAINGNDVMQILGLTPGPQVGSVLKGLFNYVLEEGPEVNTRECLLAQLQGG